MALPTLEKTYGFQHWSGAGQAAVNDTNREAMMEVKDLLLATGRWIVVGSSGNGAFGLDGVDRWTQYSYVATNRWIVLENTDIGTSFQICIQINASVNSTDCYYSASGDYVNSTTETETTRPTASDEVLVADYFLNLSNTNGARRIDIVHSTDGEVWWLSGSSNGDSLTHLCYLAKPKSPHANWPSPYILKQSSAFTVNGLKNVTDFFMNNVPGGHNIFPVAEGDAGSWIINDTNNKGVDADGNYLIQPIEHLICYDYAKPGFWGQLYDFFMAPDSLATGTMFPQTGTGEFIKLLDMIIPWDDTVYP